MTFAAIVQAPAPPSRLERRIVQGMRAILGNGRCGSVVVQWTDSVWTVDAAGAERQIQPDFFTATEKAVLGAFSLLRRQAQSGIIVLKFIGDGWLVYPCYEPPRKILCQQ